MLILVRKTRARGEQDLDSRDLEVSARTLRVGSGKNAHIQLFGGGVGSDHARLRPLRDGRLKIHCRGGNRVAVEGSTRARTVLNPGQTADIGPHRVTASQAPPGFDAAVDVRIDIEATQPLQNRLKAQFALKLPRIRALNYVLALAVAIIGLGLPLAGFYHEDITRALTEATGPTVDKTLSDWGVSGTQLGKRLAAATDNADWLWSSGDLANAHHLPAIADNCNVCHVDAFVRVRDAACINCHDETTAHFAPKHPMVAEFEGHCRACHSEHNEPSTLIVRDNALCADCHAVERPRLLASAAPVGGLPVDAAPPTVRPATAFSADAHPDFLVSLVRPADRPGGGWQVYRTPLDADVRETSNLIFPHELHLNPEKVSFADGPSDVERALVCTDCHQLEPQADNQGEHFAPITMESTCRGCHSLAFDDVTPDRQLPHGQPETLRTYLQEYYVTQAAKAEQAPPPEPARRVPETAPMRRCTGDPLDCGLAWADAQMDKLFTKAGCVTCHEVHQDSVGQWQVAPVRLVADWYPAARFDHVPHLNPEAGAENETCSNCHEAEASEKAHDVLMPGLDNCVQCHGDNLQNPVALQCTTCHAFHRPGMATMGGGT